MKKTTSVKWGNLKVGILITIAVVALFWASLSGGGTSIFDSKGDFICYFKNVNGLVKGSPVWMSGVEVGNVKSISFVNLDSLRQVEVVCKVKKSIWKMITEDSHVELGTIGFLGDKFVEIIPGTTGKPAIAENSILPTYNANDAANMFKAGEDAFKDAGSLVNNLDSVLARMERGEGTLGQLSTNDKLYTDLASLIKSLTKVTTYLQKNQERIITSVERTSNSVAGLTDKVNENKGTLGRIVNDPELYDNLAATSVKLDSILYKINTAEGTLGLFVNDTTLYSEFSNLLGRVNSLITDIEKNPRKYFKFSVF
ncbi:MAG: MlaD family protein [candidate division Zixibacteria bacterium]|nr:MlaD family protein [candidate division Zixibacteria bacterium]